MTKTFSTSVLVMVCMMAFAVQLFSPNVAAADSATPSTPPAPCGTFVATGYLFDSTYQSEGYDANGLLQIHLKMLPKYDDGRNWVVGFNLYRADCSSEFTQIHMPDFAVPANVVDYSIRFTTPTHFDVWDDDHETPIVVPAGYTWTTDLPAKMGDGTPYTQVAFSGYVQGEGTSVVSTSAPVQGTPPLQRDPVIIVPGVLGTVMQDQDVTLWPNLTSMLLDPTSRFMDPLAMTSIGTPTDPNVAPQGVLSSINYTFGTFHYSDTLTQLLTANGYVGGTSMFTFPYDWRLDPETLSVKLAAYVKSVLASTGAPKVDIVAHSYGGLVLKQYLSDIHTSGSTATAAEQQIGKLVFVAVPNLGTAEAAKALIFGSNFGVPLLSEQEVQVLAANMPSIYSLLPSADYYSYIAGFYDDLANPLVKQILSHSQAESLLLGLGKNAAMLTAADQFHSLSLDEFDFSSRPYQAYNIVGCGLFTVKTIDRMYSGTGNLVSQIFRGPKYRIYADSGDGTVLVPSASHLAVPAGNTYYVNGAEHSGILSNTPAESQILEILAGQPTQTASGVTQNSSTCTLQGKLISYNQDMDITITDLTTNTKVDPSTFQNENIDTGSNIFIPTGSGSNYSVTLTPKAAPAQTEAQPSGSVPSHEDVSVTQIANQTSTVYNYDQVPASPQDPITVGVGDAAAPTVTDQNPSGSTSTVQPTASFDQGQIATVAPLVTTVRAYVGQVLPSSGVLPLNEADPQIQFSTSDAANFVSYSFSFDGGATYTVTTDQAAIESVPGGTGSVMFYSISKQDIAEVPQTVSIDWTVTPQTITQPASSPTVVVEPPAQPLIQPTPVPQDDQQGEQPVQPSQTGDLLQGSPQADSAALDSSTVIGGGDSVDSGTADSEKTIPPININITVRQLGDPAAPAVPTSAVDNSTSTTTGSVPNESTAVLVGQVPPLFSAIFGTIWSFLSAVAHLMFI